MNKKKLKKQIEKLTSYSEEEELFTSRDIDKITRKLCNEEVIDFYLEDIRFGLGFMIRDIISGHFLQIDTDNTGAVDSFEELLELINNYQTRAKDYKQALEKRTIAGKHFVTRLKSEPHDNYTVDLYKGEELIDSATHLNKEDWSDMKRMGYRKYQKLEDSIDVSFDEWYENVYLDHFRGNEDMKING